jgi:hypothetical protein
MSVLWPQVYNGKQNVLPGPFVSTLQVLSCQNHCVRMLSFRNDGVSLQLGDPLVDDWINPLIYSKDPNKVLSKAKIPTTISKI